MSSEAAALINKQVVHDARQPGARIVFGHQVVEFAERADQKLLKQVFGFSFLACETPRQAVQALEMRPYDRFETCASVFYR